MPRRTNAFQSLITRIQAALYGKRATVQESAMIYNYDTETETEIDVLVTFDLGGTSYKTGIECRDHNRPGDPSWIAELKAKREGCRLDKIIAVHSKGFTEASITLAEKYGIETIATNSGTPIDWGEKMLPFETLAFLASECDMPEGLKFEMIGKQPANADSNSSFIILPDNRRIVAAEFVDEIRAIIRDHYMGLHDVTGMKGRDIRPLEASSTVDLTVQFPKGTSLQPTEGDNLILMSASAVCFVRVTRVVITPLEYLNLSESVRATYGEFEIMGRKSNITLTEQRPKADEIGICMYIEGAAISSISKPKLIYGAASETGNSIKILVKERN